MSCFVAPMLAAAVMAFAIGLRCGIAWEKSERNWERKHKCRSNREWI